MRLLVCSAHQELIIWLASTGLLKSKLCVTERNDVSVICLNWGFISKPLAVKILLATLNSTVLTFWKVRIKQTNKNKVKLWDLVKLTNSYIEIVNDWLIAIRGFI